MLRLYCIISLLLISIFQSKAQVNSAPDLHVLLQRYNNSKEDLSRIQLQLQLSSFYLFKEGEEKSDLDSALFFSKQAELLSSNLQDKHDQEDAIFLTGEIYVEGKNYPEVWKLLNSMSDTNSVRLMHQMVEYKLNTAGSTKQDQDTSLYYAQKALDKSEAIHSIPWKAKSYLELAYYYFKKGDSKRGREILQQQFNYCHTERYIEGEINNYVAVAGFARLDTILANGIADSRNRFMSDYIEITDKDKSFMVACLIEQAVLDASVDLYQIDKIDLIENELLWAVDFGKIHGCIKVVVYRNLASLYLEQDNLNKGLYYALEAVRFIEKNGNKEKDQRPYITLGFIYNELGQYEQALVYYYKALDLCKENNIIDCDLIQNIAAVYIKTNKSEKALTFLSDYTSHHLIYTESDRFFIARMFGTCYLSLHRYGKAEEQFIKCLAYIKKYPNALEQCQTYVGLGNLYVDQKQYEKATPYLQQLLLSASATKLISYQSSAHYLLYKVDSATGNYLSAIQHLLHYKILDDSVSDISKMKQIQELKIQYETEKKDQDIVLLQKQKQLQEQGLQKTKLLRNGFLAGSVMLFLLLALVYSRYRIKQKNNRLLEQQQTKINQSNKELQQLNIQQQKLISEKEWLVKEIHHRVKNNLQIVISLLNAQSDFLDNPLALNAIQESRERMQAIALIHQKLYQPDHSTSINMNSYIHEMVSYLGSSFTDAGRISFQLNVDAIEMDVSQAVPLGLILNEAITNAVKYAFPLKKSSLVIISLHQLDSQQLLLKISDNGKGFPQGFDLSKNNSLGIQLIKLFAEQLEGTLQINSSDGVQISLLFKQQHVVGNLASSI